MTRATRRGLLAALGVALPVLVGIGYSAMASVGMTGPGPGEAGPARLLRVLGEPAVWAGVGWSLWIATASTALAAAGAVLLAMLFRGPAAGDRAARLLAVLPLPIPHIVAAVAGLLLLTQSGLLARVLAALGLLRDPAQMPALVYDRWGIGLILILAWKEFAFLALVALSVVATRGKQLEEVARTLGAKPPAVFRRVTWPLLWRGMMPAVVAVFVFVASTYEAFAVLAPSDPLALQLLTLERYTDADLTRRGDAFVLVLVGMAVSLLAVAAHEWARTSWDRYEP